MNYRLLLCIKLCILLIIGFSAAAQEFDKEYFKKHLQTKVYAIDTNASAVILYENIYTHIAYEDYKIIKKQTVHKIIKILKSDALDLANVHIYHNSIKMENVVGNTYNMAGDKVIATTLKKEDQMEKQITKYYSSKNFSLPGVKVGSVIDYSYDIITSYREVLFTWHVQEEYPKLESIFSIVYPYSLEFTSISHIGATRKEYDLEEKAENANDSFAYVKRTYSQFQKVYWIRRNVEAYKNENFIVNKENYLERLDMQLTGMGIPGNLTRFDNTWAKFNQDIWEHANLAYTIHSDNKFLNHVVDSIMALDYSTVGKATNIYKYVRSLNINHETQNDLTEIDNFDLKALFNRAIAGKELNSTEGNLLLMCMLMKAKVKTDPVFTGTSNKVSATEKFPVADRINHLACMAHLIDGPVFLDASNKFNVLGALPPEHYNGFAWIVNDTGIGIVLTTDLIKDKTIFNVKIHDITDSNAQVEVVQKLGMITSGAMRRAWDNKKETKEIMLNAFKESLPQGVTIKERIIENEDNPDANLIIKYSFPMEFEKSANSIFLNTNIVKFFKANPFIAETRKNPIEFPCQSEYGYYMSITLPANIEPDSTYQPFSMDFDNNGITYKRNIGYIPEQHVLTVNSVLSINNTVYETNQYVSLRSFFQKMLDDCNQLLILKKSNKK